MKKVYAIQRREKILSNGFSFSLSLSLSSRYAIYLFFWSYYSFIFFYTGSQLMKTLAFPFNTPPKGMNNID